MKLKLILTRQQVINKGQPVTRQQCIDTGMVMALIAIISGLYTQKYWFQFLTLVILVFNILVPKLFYPIAILWFGLSKLLGNITSKILLGIVFYLLVTPVGLIRGFYKKDPLRIREFKRNQLSVFIVRNHKYESADLRNSF